MLYQLSVPGPIEDVEEVRVLEWHGSPGHSFADGSLVVELETHKAVIEVRSAQPAILRRVICAEGDWEKIGRPLAILSDSPDEPLTDEPNDLTPLTVEFEIT